MNKIVGIVLIILGIALGAYISLYLMLYGGICQIINGINPLVAKDIAIGIIRVIFSEIGVIPAYILIAIGIYIIED